MIAGIEYCTEQRQDTAIKVWRNNQISKARQWREEIGPKGEGAHYGWHNFHRRIRTIYMLPRMVRKASSLSGVQIIQEGSRIDD